MRMLNGADRRLVMVLAGFFPECNMKDLLVIHYSRTGTARTVADGAIAAQRPADLLPNAA